MYCTLIYKSFWCYRCNLFDFNYWHFTGTDITSHYFLILIRNHAQVIVTQLLSTHDPMMKGSLDFPNLIKIHGISGEFKLNMEIYSMVCTLCYKQTLSRYDLKCVERDVKPNTKKFPCTICVEYASLLFEYV